VLCYVPKQLSVKAVSENDGETVIPYSKIFEEFKMMKK
jgi:hypothetical protein